MAVGLGLGGGGGAQMDREPCRREATNFQSLHLSMCKIIVDLPGFMRFVTKEFRH